MINNMVQSVGKRSMRILALDIGDRWTGSAISDPLKMFARPYKTVKTNELEHFLEQTITQEKIEAIVVGHPKTLRGTESEQTKKTKEHKKRLEKLFPTISWHLWDERLTSKMAARIKKEKTKEDKLKGHSIAAALILESYLSYLQNRKNIPQ